MKAAPSPRLQGAATLLLALACSVARASEDSALVLGSSESSDVMGCLRHSTAYLYVVDSEGSFTSSGSGFLMWNYAFPAGWPAIVFTARHVVDGGAYAFVKIPSDSGLARPDDSGILVNLRHDMFYHPSPDVDLAAFLLYGICTSERSEPAEWMMLPRSFAMSDSSLQQGDEVGLFCFPSSPDLSGGFRSPVLRHGVVSWLPENGAESERFVIDLPTEPGNSGGPVVLLCRYSPGQLTFPVPRFVGVVVERRFERMKREFALPDGTVIDMSYDINTDFTLVEPSSSVIELLDFACDSLRRKYPNGWIPPASIMEN